jgi:hypothetical protein
MPAPSRPLLLLAIVLLAMVKVPCKYTPAPL